jgi:hypothetical protein
MACAAMCAGLVTYAVPAPGDLIPENMSTQNINTSSGPLVQKIEDPNSPLFLACPVTALPTNGATSVNGRAPIPLALFIRSVYLVTAAEMAAAGFSNGNQLTGIGWHYATAPAATSNGTLVVLLQNTADATNLKSTTWTTAITGMTTVLNGPVTLPNTTNPFDFPFTGPAFTYTGGGVYVAFDWQWAGPTQAGTIVSCNNSGTTISTGQSNAGPVAVLTGGSAFRPETRFTPTTGGIPNDAAVVQLYAYGTVPNGFVGPQAFQALVTNNGTNAQTNLPVSLNVTGAQTFSDTVTIPSLPACGGTTTVTFAPMPLTTFGLDSIAVSIPSDDQNTNNSQNRNFSFGNALYSYKYPNTGSSGGVGNTAAIHIAAKFTVTAPTQVDTVNLEFGANTGSGWRVAIRGDAAGTPGAIIYEDSVDRAPVAGAGPIAVRLSPPVAVGAGTFYVVAEQTGATNFSLAYDFESPLRPNQFFLSLSPFSVWQDLAPANAFKPNMGATLGACTAPLSVDVTPNAGQTCGTSIQFTANVTGGTGNLTYQWTENGVDIPSATNSTLTVNKAIGSGTFSYNCKVTDDAACTNIVDPTPSSGTWIANGGACSDGNPCTDPDVCGGGVCQPGPNPCDDSNACTDDICDGQGGCTYPAHDCNDNNACTTDTCNTVTGCGHAPQAGPCEDGNPCTVGDSCSAGSCIPGNTPLPPPVQFCNNNAMTIRDVTTSLPYPATVTPSGLVPVVCKTTVNLNNFFHSFPGDVDMLLAGPSQNALIMSDVGTLRITTPISLFLDDAAASPMPATGALAGGTYQPTNYGGFDAFPAPAPAPLGGAALSVFNGVNPNGPWSLYVVDDSAGDTGTLPSWCLNITTAPCANAAQCDDNNLCTTETCIAGSCGHTQANCSDGDACTDDSCNPLTGLCGHAPANCDDANACTTDSCAAGIGCQHALLPLPIVTGLKFAANKHGISWDPVPGGAPYDIIYGDLIVLHTSGVTASTGGCLGDNGANPVSDDVDNPSAGQGFWYLSRSRGCGGVTGSYNEGGGQVANRDPLIPAPPVDCSRP